MLLLVRCIWLRWRRCRLRCHSCQLLLFLPASFHTSSLLLLATSLCGSAAFLPLCLLLFIRIYVSWRISCVQRFLFVSFAHSFAYPRLSLCLFVHRNALMLLCVCVCVYGKCVRSGRHENSLLCSKRLRTLDALSLLLSLPLPLSLSVHA